MYLNLIYALTQSITLSTSLFFHVITSHKELTCTLRIFDLKHFISVAAQQSNRPSFLALTPSTHECTPGPRHQRGRSPEACVPGSKRPRPSAVPDEECAVCHTPLRQAKGVNMLACAHLLCVPCTLHLARVKTVTVEVGVTYSRGKKLHSRV